MSRNPLTSLRLYVSSCVDCQSATQTTAVEFEGTYLQCWRQMRKLFGLPMALASGQTDKQLRMQCAVVDLLNGRSIAPLVHPVYGRFSCVETSKR